MKIAFICTGNTARSQMAEAYARHFAKLFQKPIEVYSAGANPEREVNPFTIKVMLEEGFDLTQARPKSLEEIPLSELDLVITLCDSAKESCPYIPGVKREHWPLPDPVKAEATEGEKLETFRRVRELIKERVRALIESL
uniref:Arsenate reductase ArsC n=1 Tax=Caldimicrobium thiodismutans TaxID=1653476 RepID=A0A832GR16_9BACT